MFKKLTVFLFLLVLLDCSYAVKMENLYQVDLPVHSQSASVRQAAIKEGLAAVLIKLSGKQDVLGHRDIKPYLDKAEDLVEEYSYRRNPASHVAEDYLIKVRFNQQEIDQMLDVAKISHWGENRPLSLVWLAVKDKNHSQDIIGNDKPTEILKVMQQFSQRYGLPLIFPVMDMQDMAKVTPGDVAEMDLAKLQLAGQRYSPDVMLVGSIEYKDDEYYSEWRLLANQTKWSWGLKTPTKEAAIAQVLNQVEDTLAQHYVVALDSVDSQKLVLNVSNIQNSKDLLQLLEHLKKLKSLSEVELMQVRGHSVEISAKLHGSVETLQQNASLNRRMVLKSQAGQEKLYFEWVE